MTEMEHWRLQSDMIVVEDVEFQDQSESARSQMLELVVHEVVVVVVEQCDVGMAYVSTLMKGIEEIGPQSFWVFHVWIEAKRGWISRASSPEVTKCTDF
ncbi:organic cation/carnitine transporter 2-like [Pyrus ussuriensis x Pyrus communis]|uniref:Organic cation/carnitine transporter 2-like n=1 Tax=Pyrus ussuriensis x Pyrus communis TaxID=2448454 RepID=A0A5N5FU44_9ROSA|nr:organic cation/carnitine transporter 2-like [Pyrus ussuriensis x Pyrus communis]